MSEEIITAPGFYKSRKGKVEVTSIRNCKAIGWDADGGMTMWLTNGHRYWPPVRRLEDFCNHDDITAPWETSATCEQQIQAIVDNADRQNKERRDGGPLLSRAMADMFKVIARHLDAQTNPEKAA